MRPEGTAGVARALIENKLTHTLPQKFFYHGPMFRYERPQKGRLRQFHQFGVESIGSDAFSADVEVIDLGCALLESLGLLSKSILHINTLGDDASRKSYSQVLEDYYRSEYDNLSSDSRERFERGTCEYLCAQKCSL
jgi:histidyl-tRNA synthetase